MEEMIDHKFIIRENLTKVYLKLELRQKSIHKELNMLWRSRGSREENYGDLINLLQIALKDMDISELTDFQRLKLKEIFSILLNKVVDSEMSRAIKLFKEAEIDVWRGFYVEELLDTRRYLREREKADEVCSAFESEICG